MNAVIVNAFVRESYTKYVITLKVKCFVFSAIHQYQSKVKVIKD